MSLLSASVAVQAGMLAVPVVLGERAAAVAVTLAFPSLRMILGAVLQSRLARAVLAVLRIVALAAWGATAPLGRL